MFAFILGVKYCGFVFYLTEVFRCIVCVLMILDIFICVVEGRFNIIKFFFYIYKKYLRGLVIIVIECFFLFLILRR